MFTQITIMGPKINKSDFTGGTVHKNLPAKAGDVGSVPSVERFHVLCCN